MTLDESELLDVEDILEIHAAQLEIASMGDGPCIPLRRSNREAAGLKKPETRTRRIDRAVRMLAARPPRPR